MDTFSFKSSLVLFCSTSVILMLTGCASRSALVDYDKNTNFTQLKTFYVYSVSDDDQISAARIVSQAQRLLENKGGLIVDAEFSDASVEIEHYIEEQANDSRFSIGIGTGSFGRSSSIGVGGSVDLPVSKNLIPYAVVSLRVIANERLVWQGSQRVEVENGESQGIANAQLEALDNILAEYPLSKEGP